MLRASSTTAASGPSGSSGRRMTGVGQRVNMMSNGPKWVSPDKHYKWRPYTCRLPQPKELEKEVKLFTVRSDCKISHTRPTPSPSPTRPLQVPPRPPSLTPRLLRLPAIPTYYPHLLPPPPAPTSSLHILPPPPASTSCPHLLFTKRCMMRCLGRT